MRKEFLTMPLWGVGSTAAIAVDLNRIETFVNRIETFVERIFPFVDRIFRYRIPEHEAAHHRTSIARCTVSLRSRNH